MGVVVCAATMNNLVAHFDVCFARVRQRNAGTHFKQSQRRTPANVMHKWKLYGVCCATLYIYIYSIHGNKFNANEDWRIIYEPLGLAFCIGMLFQDCCCYPRCLCLRWRQGAHLQRVYSIMWPHSLCVHIAMAHFICHFCRL